MTRLRFLRPHRLRRRNPEVVMGGPESTLPPDPDELIRVGTVADAVRAERERVLSVVRRVLTSSPHSLPAALAEIEAEVARA